MPLEHRHLALSRTIALDFRLVVAPFRDNRDEWPRLNAAPQPVESNALIFPLNRGSLNAAGGSTGAAY